MEVHLAKLALVTLILGACSKPANPVVLPPDPPPQASPHALPPAQDKPTTPPTDDKIVKSLEDSVKHWRAIRKQYRSDYGKAGKDRAEVTKKYEEQLSRQARDIVVLASQAPSQEASLNALAAMIRWGEKDVDTKKVLKLLAEHHSKSKMMAHVVSNLARNPAPHVARFVDHVIRATPDEQVRAKSKVALGRILLFQASIGERLRGKHGVRQREIYDRYHDAETLDELAKLDLDGTRDRAEKLFDDVVRAHRPKGKKPYHVARAEGELFARRNLAIGRQVPEIEGEDLFGKPMKLSEYKGKVIVLDFWGDW